METPWKFSDHGVEGNDDPRRSSFAFDDLPNDVAIKYNVDDEHSAMYVIDAEYRHINFSLIRGMVRMAIQAVFGYVSSFGTVSCVCTLSSMLETAIGRRHAAEAEHQIIICGYGHVGIRSKAKKHGLCRHNHKTMKVMTIARVDDDPRTRDSEYAQGEGGLRTYVGIRLECLPECTICVLFLENHASDVQVERTSTILMELVEELNSSIKIFLEHHHDHLETQAVKESHLRIKNTLLYLSHEVRNQLVPWALYIEDIEDGDEKQMMSSTLTTVNDIMSRVLTLGKAGHANGPDSFGYFKLHSVFKACDAYMHDNTKNNRPVTYKRTITCDSDLEVLGDAVNMKQCVMNLLSNANKFTKQGSITLSGDIKMETPFNQRLLLKLVVTDTGVGVPKDKLQTILEPFGQADATSGVNKGTGLGLFLCQMMVETFHKGRFTFESEVGKGSVVTMKFPLECRNSPST